MNPGFAQMESEVLAEGRAWTRQRLGATSAAAAPWVEPLLHPLRHHVDHGLIANLEKLLSAQTPASPPPDPLVAGTVEYFRHHRDHLQYASLAARGAPIGSGAMESACSQFQNRLKRRGQFWTPPRPAASSRHGCRS